MTRAMDQLILTRAVYRRRYGTDLPEASVPSRFLEEVPAPLLEELGTRRASTARVGTGAFGPSSGAKPRLRSRKHPLLLRRRRPKRVLARSETQPRSVPRCRSRPPRPAPTTPSRTSPSSSPAAARSSPSPKRPSKSPPASADSAPARASAIPNMAKARSTSAKEKAKKPRLRYNFLASA